MLRSIRYDSWRRRPFASLLVIAAVIITSAIGLGRVQVEALSANSAPLPIMGANPFGYRGLERYKNTTLCTTPTNYGLEACQTPETTASLQAQALALVKPIPGRADNKSLAGLGYNFLQLDNTWQGPRVCPPRTQCDLTTQGDLTANPNNFTAFPAYPNCTAGADCFHDLVTWIKSQCDAVTNYCLKVGIYSDWGYSIGFCPTPLYTNTYNGLWRHETSDAATFHNWGISNVKIDSICGWSSTGDDPNTEFPAIRDAFAAYDNTSNPLTADVYWYGISNGWSNFWRLGGDQCGCFSGSTNGTSSLLDQVDAVESSVTQQQPPNPAQSTVDWAGPTNGQWDDMDNLLLTGTNGFGAKTYNYLTPLEQRSQFGLQALNASILEVGSDVRNLVGCSSTSDPTCSPSSNWPAPDAGAMTNFVANDQVIWADQDALGDMSRVVACAGGYPCTSTFGNWEIRSKVITNFGQTGTRVVGLLNRSDVSTATVTVTFNELRKETEREADGTQPAGGLHNVQHVYDMWSYNQNTGNMTDLVNSSGTITLGTGIGTDTIYTISYICNSSQCTFGSATGQHIPIHGLILLKIVGTSD